MDAHVYSPSSERSRRSARRHMFEVLEAIMRNGRSDLNEVAAKAGYNKFLTRQAIVLLREVDYVARIRRTSMPIYEITEPGKIAWSIWCGRQRKKLARKLAA